MPFEFQTQKIPDVILVTPKVFRDDRGFFTEVYKYPDFEKAGLKKHFVQINHSRSQKNVLRGLHYQKEPMAQAKLVRVIVGEVFDVAVDLRKDSPWYGQWVGVYLNAHDLKMLYIPEGFAHGFCVTSDIAEAVYYTTNVYSPTDERGIAWNDPLLKISWPVKDPIVSKKDSAYPFLNSADNNFTYSSKQKTSKMA